MSRSSRSRVWQSKSTRIRVRVTPRLATSSVPHLRHLRAIVARARVPPAVHRLQQGAVRSHEDEADDEEEGDDDPRRPGEGEERGEDTALLVLPAEGEVAPAAGGAAVFGDLGKGVSP